MHGASAKTLHPGSVRTYSVMAVRLLSRISSNAGEDAMAEVKPRVNETLIHFEGDVAQQIGLPRAGHPYRNATLEQQAWWKGWDEARARSIPSKSA